MVQANSQPPNLAFLLANWYSGATLLTLLLGHHKDVVTHGETFPGTGKGPVRDSQCSCGEKISSCPEFRRVAGHMWNGDGYEPSLFRWTPIFSEMSLVESLASSTRLSGPIRSAATMAMPAIAARVNRFIEAQEVLHSRSLDGRPEGLYLDGCKSLRRLELFAATDRYTSIPVILQVRHPVSWCGSWREKRPESTIEHAVKTWREYIRRAVLLQSRFPSVRMLVSRYEDLCNDSEAELRRLIGFLGLPWDPRCLEPSSTGSLHVLGNRMRLTFDGTVHPPRDRSDLLTPAEREQVLAHARKEMSLVGYN